MAGDLDIRQEATMKRYFVEVRYRTTYTCNASTVEVEAENMEEAIKIASDKVRKRRGVTRIDGGHVEEPRITNRRQS
jgi:translation initiation factor 1 (eIF-1/SUI1)